MSPPTQPLIALFTDFGTNGPYVGQMHAVLLEAGCQVIDLMHDAPRFNPRASGLLLDALVDYLPVGSVVVAVVDPGVGGVRRPLVVHSERVTLVGPDNGLFGAVLARSATARAEQIVWSPCRLSTSFHGRDLFAPVAARICKGEGVQSAAVALESVVRLGGGNGNPEIIYIDGFGNAFTGIRGEAVGPSTMIRCGGQVFYYARTFGDSPVGAGFWYVNSIGLVEIAINQGSAADELGIRIGQPVAVERVE